MAPYPGGNARIGRNGPIGALPVQSASDAAEVGREMVEVVAYGTAVVLQDT